MNWLNLAAAAVARFFQELDRHRAEAKRIRREDRFNAIKDDPSSSHADRFGASSGRVSVNPHDTDEHPK